MHGALSIVLVAAMAAGRPIIFNRPVRGKIPIAAPRTGPFAVTATPATITFNAANPQTSPVVAGSATATIAWAVNAVNKDWDLQIQAASAAFANCPTVPVSAVTVSCASTSADGGGTGTCVAPFPLSTTALPVASGTSGKTGRNFSVTVNFTLADSWKYIAEINPACSLSLTYTATVQ